SSVYTLMFLSKNVRTPQTSPPPHFTPFQNKFAGANTLPPSPNPFALYPSGGPPPPPADLTRLNALYTQWDGGLTNPLLANEVAQEIWFILDNMIKNKYTNIQNIVIVGGDNIIPFYRVPDETVIANEADYAQQLGTNVLNPAQPLYNSLFYRFVQTDNFYADRKPTPWRGRALYLPDLAIGRLVESPADINRYLDGYVAANSYTIRGDLASTQGA